MTPAPAAPAVPAATAPRELVAAMDGQSATLAATALMKSALGDPGIPQQVEVANDKQEWEICGIIDKEDVYGVPHYYWVHGFLRWCPNMKRGRRALWWLDSRQDSEHNVSRRMGKDEAWLLPSKAGKQAAA
jgi:hypothetical protein